MNDISKFRHSGWKRHSKQHRPKKSKLLKVLRVDSLLFLILIMISAALYTQFFVNNKPLAIHKGAAQAHGSALMDDGEALAALPVSAKGEQPRFLLYNVRNYFVKGERTRSDYISYPKSEESRDAVADVIAHSRADIVGVIEIGGRMALEDLRERLAKRGVDYPHHRVLERQGEDRALAILSLYPIIADNSRPQYPLYGSHRRMMLRGILDVTVQLSEDEKLRIMGAHLKSRVTDDQAKATALRSSEAQTVAQHLAEVSKQQPHMPILLFGDWNDPPLSSSIAVLEQGKSKESAMSRIAAKDSQGEEWTIYYKKGRSYYTFDQIYVNNVLKARRSVGAKSGILGGSEVKAASDHRPVWMDL